MTTDEIDQLFDIFKSDGYRLGACSVRVYDRSQTDIYPDDFLIQLWRALKSAGTLPQTFCGMQDLSAPSITAYLSTRSPLLLMCVDNPDTNGFDVIGFSFPTVWAGPAMGKLSPDPGRSMLMGYACTSKKYYRSPELIVGMMLTGVYYFSVYNLLSISGQSYEWNHLTRKFLMQFGAKTTGFIPDFLLCNGKMTKCILTSLDRDDFAEYVRLQLEPCTGA